ncbi:MAG: tetratricopeptide repeat protein, partial [Chromatiales bacterium]
MDINILAKEADQGNVVSQTILGIMYLDGLGVEINYIEAKKLLESAADKGAPRALSNLGKIYEHGLGVEKDLEKAADLYQESAFAGEFLAHIWLARLLQKHGYKEDAVEWYRNALKIDG